MRNNIKSVQIFCNKEKEILIKHSGGEIRTVLSSKEEKELFPCFRSLLNKYEKSMGLNHDL